ncbi:peptidase S45 penicillin amidase [Dickeya chrysanthemi Ech1591]|uniref:Peptidase S45 penicillin amidase n=1 Tax=Dickeya chrysanthemi (strain Ech1591) TaxID=561229 RepID=C6CG47_DICC1|nr:penicillin acylase family protein [Dickeya chrysanthemi]ACT06617.1 peptidase S45 penicillin amidase [Dickeya chrysanthemi Ech1591]
MRINNGLRIMAGALALGVVLMMALVVAVWGLLGQSLPQLDGELSVPGLHTPVTVERDEAGVPSIRAADRLSAVFALGFVHAQDRFFQMDLLRRSAAGELSALVGAAALPLDRRHRLFLLRQQVTQRWQSLPMDQQQTLRSYAAGVNAGLNSLKTRPFEYWLLRAEPQVWLPQDTLLVIAAMYFDLQDNQFGREYARGWIAGQSTPEQADFLLPEASVWDAPLVGQLPPGPALPVEPPAWWGRGAQSAGDSAGIDEQAKGSNGWLVRTPERAILANDMHLGLSLPTVWYRAQLIYPADGGNWRLTGLSLPGAPAIVSGSNGDIAWGFTNSYADTFDWVKLNTTEGNQRSVQETLAVSHGEPQSMTIETSDWGPVVATGQGRMAMHWVLQLPGSLDLSLMSLAETRTVLDALAVGQRTGLPVQNLLVADRHGHIGWTLAGTLPDRLTPGAQNSFPLMDIQQARWRDTALPAAAHPELVDPPQGVIVTANNRLLFDEQGERVGDGGADPGIRASAIHQALNDVSQPDLTAMHRIQLDNRALLAASWRDRLLDCLEASAPDTLADQAVIRTLLQQWNGQATADSTAYLLLNRWREAIYQRLFGTLDQQLAQAWPKAGYRVANPRWDVTVQQLMHDEARQWVPAPAKDWCQLSLQQLEAVWRDNGEGRRNWGEVNQSHIAHPLASSLPLLGRLLQVPARPLSGDNHVPHVNRPTFGASERLVVSPGDEANATLSLPGGQSGNPLSRWWLDGYRRWMSEAPTPLLPGAGSNRLELKPASAAQP